MQPYSRARTNREVPEKVHVRSVADTTTPPHLHSSVSRKRSGRKTATLFSIAFGTLVAMCVTVVYIFTAGFGSIDVKTADRVKNKDSAVFTAQTAGLTAAPVEKAGKTATTSTTATTTTTGLPSPITPRQYVNIFDREDTRTARPEPAFKDMTRQYESGEYQPEEPERVPGLTVTRHTYTPAELLEKFRGVDYIYSFVNGSEVNHHFRKASLVTCARKFMELERNAYTNHGIVPPEMQLELHNGTPACYTSYLAGKLSQHTTIASLLKKLSARIRPGIGDRETDELRHSIRSLEQHVRWHRGRVVIVSPGHHPTWVDGAKNFLAGACGDASVQALRLRGTHLRLTTVNQDALMPYGIRLTVNSHSIEQHIWRLRNITPVHVYMNDDYFVNRDVAITDLFNEYGGTIVRTEKGILREGIRGPLEGGTWNDGSLNTQAFNIMELDMRHEDYLPADLESLWIAKKEEQHVDLSTPIPPIAPNEIIDTALTYKELDWPTPVQPRRYRRYATHAPFVYCTNMHRFMQTRYAREFAYNSFLHRVRRGRDLYVPFVYNAFVMARPWQASPQFLPYLLQLHRSRNATPTEAPPSVEISLDNFDGCAPASLRGGWRAAKATFMQFRDKKEANEKVIHDIARKKLTYFNINTAFSSDTTASQLREFLHDKFPTPIYLEQFSPSTTADPEDAGAGGDEENATTTTTTTTTAANAVLTPTFDALMALPVVGVVSYEEGVCPLVRSLWLAFAGHHRGRVHVAVQRHSLGEAGEADESLRETRRRLGHRVLSSFSGVRCAFGSLVSVGPANRTEALADIALRALRESGGAGVELPSTCGNSGDNDGAAAAGAGLRVRGFVIDARTPSAPVKSVGALRDALAMPGQTLALEDFRAVRVGPEDRDVVLVLAREDADAKAVHWITSASENDLLVTYPLPVEAYEDLDAPVRWSQA
ncbi:hypothetical protein N2W54_000291 [Lotmaria passim]